MKFAAVVLLALGICVARADERLDEEGSVIVDEEDARLLAKRSRGLSRGARLNQFAGACLTDADLAATATGSGSAGGSGAYGPGSMNDGTCNFYWPLGNAVQGGRIQYDWNTSVTVDRIVLMTDLPCPASLQGLPTHSCSFQSGRNIAQGTVEFWDTLNSQWVVAGSFSHQAFDRIEIQFPACATTNAIRVTGLRTPGCNAQSQIKVYEWHVCECTPPPIVPLDYMCQNLPGTVNVAPLAVASSVGNGGVNVLGPAKMNDEAPTCIHFHTPWSSEVFGNATGAEIEYTWPAPVTIQETIIATVAGCGVPTVGQGCQHAPSRGINSGIVEYWDGAAWISAGAFAGNTQQRIHFRFAQCITTTRLRVRDARMHACTGITGDPIVFEWAACTC